VGCAQTPQAAVAGRHTRRAARVSAQREIDRVRRRVRYGWPVAGGEGLLPITSRVCGLYLHEHFTVYRRRFTLTLNQSRMTCAIFQTFEQRRVGVVGLAVLCAASCDHDESKAERLVPNEPPSFSI